MACILCLETEIDIETSIRIFSAEGEGLSIKNIISQHFWIEPKEDHANQWICQPCWGTLSEFHEFYLRVEAAHRALKQRNKEIINAADPISSENATSTYPTNSPSHEAIESQNKTAPITKRKRRRWKSSEVNDALEELPIDTDSFMPVEEQLNVEKLDDIDIFSGDCKSLTDVGTAENIVKAEAIDIMPKKKRGRPPICRKKSNKPAQTTTDMLIKAELDFADIMDEDFTLQLTAAVDSQDSVDAYTKEDTKKIYAERKNLSLEYDEYIAENFKLSCCLCQFPLKDFTQLKTHFRVEHEMRGYVICCGKKLLKRGVLVDHLHTHQDPEYFKCTECGKVMSDRRCLDGHMKTHQAKGQPAFTCEICSKSYHRRVVYMRHIQNHMPEDMKKFQCPECPKKFATNYLMNQHLKLVHLNTYSKICDVCGKKIHGRDALQRHQALHESVPPPPIQCDLCGLTLTTKYGLTRHMKAKHIADYQQPQVCPYCSKVSPNYFAQKRHIYYMHNIERRHACPMCEKAFKRTKDLREHMTTHTGDILYTCTYCPKTFNSDANMYAHRKRVHRKEWEQKMREKFPLAIIKGEEAESPMPPSESEETFFS